MKKKKKQQQKENKKKKKKKTEKVNDCNEVMTGVQTCALPICANTSSRPGEN